MDRQPGPRAIASALSQAGRQEATALAEYLRSLPATAANRQSACTEWTIAEVAAHVASGGAFFRDAIQQALAGEAQPALPAEQFGAQRSAAQEALRARPLGDLAGMIAATTEQLYTLVDNAGDEELMTPVKLPFGDWPIIQVATVRLSELALHHWDVRSVDDPAAKLSATSANLILPGLAHFAAMISNRAAVAAAGSRSWQLEVAGAHPSTIGVRVAAGALTVEHGAVDRPVATLALDAEQLVRLIWGRLPLGPAIDAGAVDLTGDRTAALELNAIFQGV
ncbi:MAG: maleylpyruvate isomerase family mycothiol-dependent enzyme [Chloroflexi bacterium]|nr:maleylpyruvate isomerase family mycothiol-dependent enzyme [Chloroflexota bacterium]